MIVSRETLLSEDINESEENSIFYTFSNNLFFFNILLNAISAAAFFTPSFQIETKFFAKDAKNFSLAPLNPKNYGLSLIHYLGGTTSEGSSFLYSCVFYMFNTCLFVSTFSLFSTLIALFLSIICLYIEPLDKILNYFADLLSFIPYQFLLSTIVVVIGKKNNFQQIFFWVAFLGGFLSLKNILQPLKEEMKSEYIENTYYIGTGLSRFFNKEIAVTFYIAFTQGLRDNIALALAYEMFFSLIDIKVFSGGNVLTYSEFFRFEINRANILNKLILVFYYVYYFYSVFNLLTVEEK